jgi:methyl-accepting chemotaxis protein
MIDLVADSRILNVELLPAILADQLFDYRQWFDNLRRATREGRSFQGELNPMASNLGRWLATYQTEDPTLGERLDALGEAQHRLHAVATAVAKLLDRGRIGPARERFDREGPPAFAAFRAAVKNTREYVDERLTGYDVAINYVFGDVDRAFTESIAALREVSREVTARARVDSEQAVATGDRSRFIALAATGVGLLLALGFGLALARHMTRRLGRAVTMLGELEQGHLDVRLDLPGRDEISDMSRAMDVFAEDLQARVLGVNAVSGELVEVSERITMAARGVDGAARAQAEGVTATSEAVGEIAASVREVGEGVEVLSTASANSTSSVLEMSANSEELAGNAESLARIVEEVGSAISEMAVSIQQVAGNTGVLKESSDATASSVTQMQSALGRVDGSIRETAQATEGVLRDVESGQASVERTSTGIQEIRQASKITSEAIASLSDKVENIGRILAMIDDITDQTGLLALNAAIIAAQAGEHGKGFAVVAEEIRELSDRATRSTREIADVIGSVQQETGRVVEAVARVERRVTEGEELSRASGSALEKIVQGIQAVDQRMEQIARATREQAAGAEVIGGAMDRVAEMVDQNVGATREQNNAVGTITAAVEDLRNLTLQVRTSAREQSCGSKSIAGSMADVDEMIRKINQACAEQTRGSRRIEDAVEAIRRFAEANLESTAILQAAVHSQNRQIDVLKEQMGAFRVTECPALPSGIEEQAEAGDLVLMELEPAVAEAVMERENKAGRQRTEAPVKGTPPESSEPNRRLNRQHSRGTVPGDKRSHH